MAIDTPSDLAAREEQKRQTTLALIGMLVPAFFAIMFAACIIGACHEPHPNHIKVGVVGPTSHTATLRAGLAKQAGSAFEIRPVATVAAAEHAVRNRDLAAAFAQSAAPRMPTTLIVATGGGRLVAIAAETLARAVTDAEGTQLVVRDVRPLASDDEIGLGIFLYLIICTIAGYLAVTVLFTAAPALTATRRYTLILANAVVVPTLVYLIGGLGYGTYTGSFGTILAFIGVGVLYTLIVGLGTRLLQTLLGPAGLFVSLAIFVFLNIPSLGATYTSTMLSQPWRFLNEFWLGAATVNAERSLLYFGWQDVSSDLLWLLGWAAAILVLLLLPASRRLERSSVATALAPTGAPRAAQH